MRIGYCNSEGSTGGATNFETLSAFCVKCQKNLYKNTMYNDS